MLTPLQKKICFVLRNNRNEKSCIAGGSMLNFDTEKLSLDIDIFNSEKTVCEQSFENDIQTLKNNGFKVQIDATPNKNGMGGATIFLGTESTKIQWVIEFAWRFFPTEYNDFVGYHLNSNDLIINKLICLADRKQPRDFADICLVIDKGIDLAGYFFGVAGKDPVYSVEFFFNVIRKNIVYSKEDFNIVTENEIPKNYVENLQKFRLAMQRTKESMEYIPRNLQHVLFLDENQKVFLPTQQEFKENRFIIHSGQLFGSIPQFVDKQELQAPRM